MRVRGVLWRSPVTNSLTRLSPTRLSRIAAQQGERAHSRGELDPPGVRKLGIRAMADFDRANSDLVAASWLIDMEPISYKMETRGDTSM